MLVGPTATKVQIEHFRAALIAEPHRYIAQPTTALSTVPTTVESGVAPRHVDFRPFVLTGREGVEVTPGADPRRAARGLAGRQFQRGGGTKDSFVLMPPEQDHWVQTQTRVSQIQMQGTADALADRLLALLARALFRASRLHRPAGRGDGAAGRPVAALGGSLRHGDRHSPSPTPPAPLPRAGASCGGVRWRAS